MREWCNHGTLTDAILKGWLQAKDTRSVSHVAVLATAFEIAGALMCLHKQDVVHGDLTGDWSAPAPTQSCADSVGPALLRSGVHSMQG